VNLFRIFAVERPKGARGATLLFEGLPVDHAALVAPGKLTALRDRLELGGDSLAERVLGRG
jgi:hypothetical protein